MAKSKPSLPLKGSGTAQADASTNQALPQRPNSPQEHLTE